MKTKRCRIGLLVAFFCLPLVTRAATRTWVGLGGNAFWTTTANWSGGSLPAAADDVMFPSATPIEGTQNNLLGALRSLTFGDGGYSVGGNSITLTNGINATNTSGTVTLATTLLAGANQSITNLNAGAELLIASLDLHGHSVTFRGAGTNHVYTSILDSTGGGSLTNAGTGVFELAGTNLSFTGPTVLNAGTNIINASYKRSPITWTAGTLGGTGTLGSVTASGASAKTLAPGHLGGGPLSLSNLVLNSSVTFVAQISGTNLNTDYGRITINGGGTSHLGSAALSVSFDPNLSPLVGTKFYLFLTDPSTTLSDTFTNLPEGSSITNNGIVCDVSYNFGHGVILTVSDVQTSGSRSWDGGGADNHWMTASNWSGNVAPVQGNSLLFNANSINPPLVQPTNFNDFPPETTFGLLSFSIPTGVTLNSTLLGNSFRLNDGVRLVRVTVNNITGSGTIIISNHLALNLSQTFSNDLPATLHFAGGVELGGNTLLAVARVADIFFDGSITGDGHLQTRVVNVGGGIHLLASNAITGDIFVTNGLLSAEHAQALGSASGGPVTVGAGGTLRLGASNTIFTASSIVLTGRLEAVGSMNSALSAPLIIAGSNAVIVVSNNFTLAGAVTNNTQLTNAFGSGILRLGPTCVIEGSGVLTNFGSVDVDGIVHNTVQIGRASPGFSSGTLSGAGQIDTVIANNGTLAPGSATVSSNALDPLSVGRLTLGNFVTLEMELFPNRPANSVTNDMLIVTNPPTLGFARLHLLALTNLTPGQQFTVLKNLSGAPVTNIFTDSSDFRNLPEGAFVGASNGNLGLSISYVGGSGHDIVLTAQTNTPPIFATPTNNVSVVEGNTLTYSNVITDFERPTQTFTWTLLTPISGLNLNATNGVLTWTPTEAQGPSTNNILVKVSDSGTPPMSSTGTVVITVNELNSFPVPILPTNTNVLAGDTLIIQLQATDPDIPANPLTWQPISITSGATLTTNGLFTYTPGLFDGGGTKTEQVRVFDFNAGAVSQQSLTNNLTFHVQVTRRRIVTNTNLFGAGSLSNAIYEIGTNASGGYIHFNIPGAGPFKIAPATALDLPVVAANTYLDGYSQPGAHPNTKTNGTDAVILIELSGENQSSGNGFSMSSSVTIRGLCINRFTNGNYAIVIGSCCGTGGFCDTSGDALEGCFIGTDTSGTIALPNTLDVAFTCGHNSRVGGPDIAQRNLISGSLGDAISVSGHPANPLIQNNLIGTDRTGTNALPNGGSGISISTDGGGFSSCVIADNVISGNVSYGVGNANAPNVTLVRNKIGVGADGLTPRGNGSGGVSLNGTSHLVGGTNAADGNLIAYNNGVGVDISGSKITVEGNSIFRNSGRAIKLESGANNSQTAPVLTNVMAVAGSVTIEGTLTSSNGTYRLEFFHNPDFAPSNAPQAWIFLGATNITTDTSSNANFSVTFNQTVSGGFLTAAATDAVGNTSAISEGLALPSRPQLGITLISGQARLLWLTNFSNFILQTNASVAQSNGWGDLPGAPGVIGSNFFRDFAPTGATRFFRLRSL